MKFLKEYHIETYWAEEAERRQRNAEIRKLAGKIALMCAFLGLGFFVTYEFMDQLMEVI